MKSLRIFPVVALFALLSACNAPLTLTQQNLDKVQPGMTSAQVKEILGAPADSRTEPIPVVGGTKTTYVYTHESDTVTIVLKNDTVQTKEGHFTAE